MIEINRQPLSTFALIKRSFNLVVFFLFSPLTTILIVGFIFFAGFRLITVTFRYTYRETSLYTRSLSLTPSFENNFNQFLCPQTALIQ